MKKRRVHYKFDIINIFHNENCNNNNCLAVSIWFRKRVFDAMPAHIIQEEANVKRQYMIVKTSHFYPSNCTTIIFIAAFFHTSLMTQLTMTLKEENLLNIFFQSHKNVFQLISKLNGARCCSLQHLSLVISNFLTMSNETELLPCYAEKKANFA